MSDDSEPTNSNPIASGCNWTHRCCAPADHDVWTAATGQVVTRRVCDYHLRVALAISYRHGTPPARLVP